MAKPSSTIPGLGAVSVLSPEIREMIWLLLIPRHPQKKKHEPREFPIPTAAQRFREKMKKKHHLAILRASGLLFNEIRSRIHPVFPNPYIITLDPVFRIRHSFIKISNGKSDHHRVVRPFDSCKLISQMGSREGGEGEEKPGQICFGLIIPACDPKVPGQMLYLFDEIRHLLLIWLPNPQTLETEFKDTEKGSWFKDGAPVRTKFSNVTENRLGDIVGLLYLLLQQRDIKIPKISLPKGITMTPQKIKTTSNIIEIMQSDIALGEHPGIGNERALSDEGTEHCFRKYCDAYDGFRRLARGPTARNLRKEDLYWHIQDLVDNLSDNGNAEIEYCDWEDDKE